MKIWVITLALVVIGSICCQAVPPDSQDYRVGEGDVLKVMVYDNPDLETTTRVSGNGTILFPLVGEVRIEGNTVSEVAQVISRKLAQGYIIDPQVSVFVEEFRSQTTTIMGEVRAPGLYELSGPTSLMELISKAGGLTTDAGDQVTIKRKNPAQPEVDQIISVNLKNLLEKEENASNLIVVGGDSVLVPRAGTFYVTGQVNSPAAYKLEQGTSVIKAITMAGGFTELAAQRKIQIIRKIGDRETVLKKVPLHTPILAEDVIVVPESFF